MTKDKKLSLGTFVCAILFFFLPFAQVSCMGQGIAKLSGVQLAVGTTISQDDGFGHKQDRKLDGSLVALFAFVSALAGLALHLAGSKSAMPLRATAAVAGVVLLLILKSQVESASAREGQGLITVSFESGFYITLLLLAAGAAINLYSFVSQPQDGAPADDRRRRKLR